MKQEATESVATADTELPVFSSSMPPRKYSLEESLRRLAWDFAEWSQDPPLRLTGQEQKEIAIILNDAANMIDLLAAIVRITA